MNRNSPNKDFENYVFENYGWGLDELSDREYNLLYEHFQYDTYGAPNARYCVSNFESDSEIDLYTDSPDEAIKEWFKRQARYPYDVAILAYEKSDAIELMKFATPQLLRRYSSRYRTPYAVDALIEWRNDALENGARGFLGKDGSPDQVTPFTYG